MSRKRSRNSQSTTPESSTTESGSAEPETHCGLCGRELISGPSIDEHHLTPKLKGGKKGPRATIHKVCHKKIHSLFTEGELARTYNTLEKLLEHPEIQKFVVWVANKHPEFYETSKQAGRLKRK